jgi:hypothetical protein
VRFVHGPIDPPTWAQAQWQGVGHLTDSTGGDPPGLGLAGAESVAGPPADGPILMFVDDDRVRGSLSPGRPPEEAAGPPAADGAEPEGPCATSADDLRKFGTPDVLPKPFTAAETGRKLRDEEAARDDQWRNDGGQGQRPAP